MLETFETRVELGERSYSVHTGGGLLERASKLLAEAGLTGRCAIITDSNVAPLYAERVVAALGGAPDVIEVPAGEASKSFATAEIVCRRLAQAGLDRKSFVIALGGGVVGDLAGFVASIFLRGIPYAQIPTTIVSQVDSAVGGKTGVNLPEGKNLVGAFHQPRVVLCDVDTLGTLPDREFNEGFAEVIKHAIIRDAAMFEELGAFTRNQENLSPVIARNVEIKAAIVSEDEKEERDIRALLNFGHTLGHAIENAAGYGTLLHGEAIALGIVAASRLSIKHAGLSRDEYERIVARLRAFSLPCSLPSSIETGQILDAMKADKKFEKGQMRFVLTASIGSAFVSNLVTRDDVIEALAALRGDPLA
jgi:3-dehydroquinate synthase